MKPIIYWDSDCFLASLKHDKTQDELEGCEAVLTAMQKYEIELATSSFTITEVLYIKGQKKIPKKDKEKVVRFFDNSCIQLIDVDKRIAIEAREIVWEYDIKPKDAVHIATALFHNIPIFHTFDEKLLNKKMPELEIIKPDWIMQQEIPFRRRRKLDI